MVSSEFLVLVLVVVLVLEGKNRDCRFFVDGARGEYVGEGQPRTWSVGFGFGFGFGFKFEED